MKPLEQELSNFVYSEKTESFSTWKNNNDKPARFNLLTHQKMRGKHRKFGADCKASVFLKIEIQPGETKQLPSEFDQAIRKVSAKTGQIVGGLCPWLTKEGEEDMVVHKSLDYKSAFQEAEAYKAIEAFKKEDELKKALKVLEDARMQQEFLAEKKGPGRPKKDVL